MNPQRQQVRYLEIVIPSLPCELYLVLGGEVEDALLHELGGRPEEKKSETPTPTSSVSGSRTSSRQRTNPLKRKHTLISSVVALSDSFPPLPGEGGRSKPAATDSAASARASVRKREDVR